MENKCINEPTIADIIIRKDEVDVCYTTKSGLYETKLKLGDEDSEMLTVNYGDVSNIGFGGTDNWGKDRLPIYLNSNKDSIEYDGIFVDTIEIQKQSDWCKCELIGNSAVKYTSLSENPNKEPRTTYFYHTTKDDKIKRGFNLGRPTNKKWCVTVILKGSKVSNTNNNEEKNLGNYKYSIGLLSDLHICKSNDNVTPNDTSDDWGDEDDFKSAMSIFVNDSNIKCIMSCGDIAESLTNDYKKHSKSTCDADYSEFKEMYDVPYWQTAGLRFFSPLGNHDFYGLFESREGDNIIGKKNSETTFGYNANVSTRISQLWPTDGGINGIVPTRGRIMFELEGGKHTAQGLADMNFFSYNDYVDLYANISGYTGSIWDSNKGGISDLAIKYVKQYVNNNWNKVKDNLVMWNSGSGHGRNIYSKLNYWIKKDDCIFIFLSVDYGNDIWGVTSGWHDRMIHARTIINLNEDDPYIKRMKEYVSDTGYSSSDEKYNYQYYSPNTLIWLKEIIENNIDKKIFVFSHHPIPNRVGNSTGVPLNGDWSYAEISKDGEKTSAGINKGSNTLTGIEFWFINKLINKYKNVVWFTGHSHISWDNDGHFDNHDYDIVSPLKQNTYVYTKASNTPIGDSAWVIALPSLSKPRYIGSNQKSSRLYDDAEIAIMEIYDNGIKLKGYKIREKSKSVYDKNKPLKELIIILK